MNAQPTAREQFAQDIALVLDNDFNSSVVITNAARCLNDTYRLANFIRDYVERSISRAMDETQNNAGTHGALLIRQICFNWGIDPFYDYARDIMERINESAGV